MTGISIKETGGSTSIPQNSLVLFPQPTLPIQRQTLGCALHSQLFQCMSSFLALSPLCRVGFLIYISINPENKNKMRFSFNIIAASVLFLSSSVLAAYEVYLSCKPYNLMINTIFFYSTIWTQSLRVISSTKNSLLVVRQQNWSSVRCSLHVSPMESALLINRISPIPYRLIFLLL